MDDNIIFLLTKHKQCTIFPFTPPRLPYILALFKYYHSFLLNFAKTIMFCLRDCQSVCRWADNLTVWLLSPPLFQLSCLQSFCLSRLCQTLLQFSILLAKCYCYFLPCFLLVFQVHLAFFSPSYYFKCKQGFEDYHKVTFTMITRSPLAQK